LLRRLLLETLALARQIADWAAEAKAEDIVVLDVRKATYLADYFVIATATSDRHLVALAERIEDQVSQAGVEPHHVEGTPDSGWLLVDYGDVVVHVFTAPVREFYHLDKVWSEATAILHVL